MKKGPECCSSKGNSSRISIGDQSRGRRGDVSMNESECARRVGSEKSEHRALCRTLAVIAALPPSRRDLEETVAGAGERR